MKALFFQFMEGRGRTQLTVQRFLPAALQAPHAHRPALPSTLLMTSGRRQPDRATKRHTPQGSQVGLRNVRLTLTLRSTH